MKCDPAFKRCGFPGRIQAAPPSVSEQDLARTLVNYDSGALIQMINNTVTLAERLECSETVIIGSTFTAFAVAERHNYAAALSALQHDIHNTQLVLKDFLAQAEWAAKGNKPSRGMDAYNAKLTMWLGRIAASHPVTRQEYTLVMAETGSRNSCLTSTSTGQGELDWLVERLLHTPLTSYADTSAMPAKGTAE